MEFHENPAHAQTVDTRPFFFLPRTKRTARLPAREKRGTGDEAMWPPAVPDPLEMLQVLARITYTPSTICPSRVTKYAEIYAQFMNSQNAQRDLYRFTNCAQQHNYVTICSPKDSSSYNFRLSENEQELVLETRTHRVQSTLILSL